MAESIESSAGLKKGIKLATSENASATVKTSVSFSYVMPPCSKTVYIRYQERAVLYWSAMTLRWEEKEIAKGSRKRVLVEERWGKLKPHGPGRLGSVWLNNIHERYKIYREKPENAQN
jgi:hypothetical protein